MATNPPACRSRPPARRAVRATSVHHCVRGPDQARVLLESKKACGRRLSFKCKRAQNGQSKQALQHGRGSCGARQLKVDLKAWARRRVSGLHASERWLPVIARDATGVAEVRRAGLRPRTVC